MKNPPLPQSNVIKQAWQIIATVALALILLSCSPESETTEKKEVPSHQSATAPPSGPVEKDVKQSLPQETSAQPVPDKHGGPLFLELIYEIATYPLTNKALPSDNSDLFLSGYLLDKSDPALANTLYPAMGRKEWPGNAETSLWIGIRFVDRTVRPNYTIHFLSSSKNERTELTIPGRDHVDDSRRFGRLYDLLFEPVNVAIQTAENRSISVTAREQIHRAPAGKSVLLLLDQKSYGVVELEEALIAALKTNDMYPGEIDRYHIRERLRLQFPEDEPAVFHHRLSAVAHGEVTIAPFDVQTEWRKAEQQLISGPYQKALSSLENVLLAAPAHREALRRWALVKSLLDNGAAPASLHGNLAFPPGMPSEHHRARWHRHHEGLAVLSRPEDPGENILVSSPVSNGTFELHAPGDTYRLSVFVPGFMAYEQVIQTRGNCLINVKLEEK